MIELIDKMDVIPFEARKDTAQIFNNLMHKDVDGFVSYMGRNFRSVLKIAEGYANPDIALNSGSMLRECIRYEDLARQFLQSEQLWLFFDAFVHLPNFDVASDAFNTLKEVLAGARNKQIAAEFLEERYDQVFFKYQVLLTSSNYVTRRRSLKLLGEILLDRSNFNVMMRFISSEKNLQQVMNLLRDKSPNIQFE
ncbi:Cab39l [Symbiodinium microadriaticum]|nr:Cab39l [Symbiodinium microadriaticum]